MNRRIPIRQPWMRTLCVPVACFAASVSCALWIQGESTESSEPFFHDEVLPLLREHCFECHSHSAKKAKGGLVLDSRSGWEVGGASGPAVIPGNAAESLLLQAVRYKDLEMPPDSRLSDADVSILERWITSGAPDPRQGTAGIRSQGIDPNVARQHWAFQALKQPSVPSVQQSSWPSTAVDRFILHRQEQAGVYPGADADPYTWLRRVSLDLTGLPPSPHEIATFAADPSPLAKEKVVDRLLGSRAFGERWARHWLDLVGYADQVGTSNNVFAEHAWRYRDYVINSYNADKAYDEFMREQIAGDLLSGETVAQRREQLTALGFLVLGDLEIVEADKAKLLVDIVDQQVNKVGKAFMGMTLECARCHDHKFDPISQRDYYALGGFFHSTSSIYKTDRGVWSDVNVIELPEGARAKAARLVAKEKHFVRLAEWKSERVELQARHKQVVTELNSPDLEESAKEKLTRSRDTLSQRIGFLNRAIPHAEYFYPKVPRVHGVKDVSKPVDMRITVRGNPRALGDSVPRGFLSALGSTEAVIASGQSGRRELAEWLAEQPLMARVAVNRIWQKLFGEGLVRTVDYFGIPGDSPSHPELLDYLASEFSADSWSSKRLIRRLVMSRTYGLASTYQASAAARDPDNRLLWRMNSSRLDAEALRDSMIATSGQLLHLRGGMAMALEYPENVGGLDPKDVNPRSFRFSKWRPEQPFQRTVYLPVIRHAAQPGPASLRNVFDFAQPSQFTGKRSVTAVPTQALFLMNGGEVKEQAVALSNRVASLDDSEERLKMLWLLVFNRPLRVEEKNEALAFVRSQSERPWVELCHALLASNEFLMRL